MGGDSSYHVRAGRHRVGVILIREVGHGRGTLGDVLRVLLPGQGGQRVAEGIETLADVRVHMDVNAAHFPQHVEGPGPGTAALCVKRGEEWKRRRIILRGVVGRCSSNKAISKATKIKEISKASQRF